MNKTRNHDKNGSLIIKESTRRSTLKEAQAEYVNADKGGYPCALVTTVMTSAETTDGRTIWFSSGSSRETLKENSRYKTLVFKAQERRLLKQIDQRKQALESAEKQLADLREARK
jgi:hypothetical protein